MLKDRFLDHSNELMKYMSVNCIFILTGWACQETIVFAKCFFYKGEIDLLVDIL